MLQVFTSAAQRVGLTLPGLVAPATQKAKALREGFEKFALSKGIKDISPILTMTTTTARAPTAAAPASSGGASASCTGGFPAPALTPSPLMPSPAPAAAPSPLTASPAPTAAAETQEELDGEPLTEGEEEEEEPKEVDEEEAEEEDDEKEPAPQTPAGLALDSMIQVLSSTYIYICNLIQTKCLCKYIDT